MCPHKDFDIIYYKGSIILRRCKDCGRVELHQDWIWSDVSEIEEALEFIAVMSNE